MASKNKITITNIDLHDAQKTTLTQDVDVAGTTLTVSSTSGFGTISTASDYFYIIIGNYGTETTELCLVSAKTNNTFTVSALKYSHSASDPVTYTPYNKVKFYGRTVSGGANNLLATLDMDVSSQQTTYEYNGIDYNYFISTYYRSDVTAEESGASDEINLSTFTFYSVKKIIEAGTRKVTTRPDENSNGLLSWGTMIDLVNEGLNEIITRKKQWQCLHKVDNTKVTTTNVAYIDKPTDLSVMEFLYVNGKKIDYITKMRYNQYTTNGNTQLGTPNFYTIKNDKIYLYPLPNDAYTTSFEYFAMPEEITSLTQEVKKEFATALVYFVAAQAAYIRNNDKRGNLMEVKFNKVLEQQIEDVTGYEQVGESVGTDNTSYYYYDNFGQ